MEFASHVLALQCTGTALLYLPTLLVLAMVDMACLMVFDSLKLIESQEGGGLTMLSVTSNKCEE